MEPTTMALLGAAALLLASNKPGAYGEGSSKVTLTTGNYRVKFRAAKPQTDSLQQIWALPHVTMMGTGGQTRFESLTVDGADPNVWWFTGIMSYGGQPQTVDLLPGMSLERL